jgi:hypothetical protein
MRTRLLKKVRRYAEALFDTKLTRFKTENGRVTGISYVHEFKWAFYWLLGERLDYHDDREKIVCIIARIAWDRFLRDKWTRKMRKDARDE